MKKFKAIMNTDTGKIFSVFRPEEKGGVAPNPEIKGLGPKMIMVDVKEDVRGRISLVEKKADIIDVHNEEKENAFYKLCYAYQLEKVDINLSNEISKSESLVEAGIATEQNLPLAKRNGDWIESLWTLYYVEKAKLQAGDSYSADFSSIGKVRYSFADVRDERKKFLAKI